MSLLTAVAVLAIAQVDQPPTADQLLQSVLDQRLALQSGRLTFSVEDIETQFVLDYEFAFDGEQRRMDVTYPQGSFRPPASMEPSDFARVVTYIVSDSEFLFQIVELRPDPGTYAAQRISKAEWQEKVRNNPRYENSHSLHKQAFDPRIIGVATQQFGAWWRIGLSDLLESQPLQMGTVAAETLNDESVWVVDAHYESGFDKRLWFSSEKGGSIVASRVEFEDNGSQFTDVMRAEVAQYPSGEDQIWIPSEVHTYRELPDGRSSESVLRIRAAEFNSEVPPAVFAIEESELPVE